MGRSVRTMRTTVGGVGRWTVAGLVLVSVISAGVGRAWTASRGPIARATSETAEPGTIAIYEYHEKYTLDAPLAADLTHSASCRGCRSLADNYNISMKKEVVKKMNSEDLEQRGRELRIQLQKTYEELLASGRLYFWSTDISESVHKYVSRDMSFDEAEAILRAAGFTVGPHPDVNAPPDPNRNKDWYAVLAWIQNFVQHFPIQVSVYVTLFPKSPGDYTSVANVRASFLASAP